MTLRRILTFVILALIISMGGISLAGNGIIISLSLPECPWFDPRLGEKLDLYLSSINHMPIIRSDLSDTSLNVDSEMPLLEELLARGKERGGKFLVDISINRIDLERRKLTVFPLLVFRYRVYAVLTGTLRIFDLEKGRLVRLKEIEFEEKASDQWQAVDDDKNDPALIIPADEKIVLFERLENKAASSLYAEIKELTRGNYFGR